MHRDENAIRDLAHRLWIERGCPTGTADQDWGDAERQLLAEGPAATAALSHSVDDASKESFPASDAPGSHLPDEPPANADAKWEAAGVVRTD